MRRSSSFRFTILIAFLAALVAGGCVWAYHTHESAQSAPDHCLLCQMSRGAEKMLTARVDVCAAPALSGPSPAAFYAAPPARPVMHVFSSRAPPLFASL